MRRLFIAMALLAALAPGCSNPTGGTETGNSQAAVSLRVLGYQPSVAALAVGTSQIDSAKVVIGRVTFKPLSDCGGDSAGAQEISLNGPFVVDLLNPTTLPGLENVSLATGQYCRIVVTLQKLDGILPAGIDPADPIVNRSVLVEGFRQDGMPFEVASAVDQDFELSNGTAGFPVLASALPQVFFIAFNVNEWFNGVDLMDPSLVISSDGGNPILLINDGINQSVQEMIEDNLKRSSDLFKDSDANNNLDSEEEVNSLAAGTPLP